MKISHKSYKQILLLTAISALMSILAFPPCAFSTLIWMALVPWLYSLTYQNWRQIFISNLVFQIGYFAVGLLWMTAVHPLCPVALLLPLYFICLPTPLLIAWSVQKANWPIFIAAPIIWAADEYLRSFIFSGFPYLYLGHSQAFNPTLVQIADITGVYGVSFVIVMVNALGVTWWQWWQRTPRRRLTWPIAASLICVATLAGVVKYGQHRLDTITYAMGPKVAAIQGNIPQDIKDDPSSNRGRILESYTRLTAAARQHNPQLLLWPETMSPGDPQLDPLSWQYFRNLAQGKLAQDNPKQNQPLYLLIGSHFYDCDFKKRRYQTYNTAYFYQPDGKIVERYDKIHLVPIGEYIPTRTLLPFLPQLILNLVGFIPDLATGTSRPVFRYPQYPFGCMICYDIAYSEEARILAGKGCRFIVNLTNEGWFANTSELEQLLAISVFRAIENRIGIIRAGNTGITLTIPPTGLIQAKNVLHIPIAEYFESLQPYLRRRLASNELFTIDVSHQFQLDQAKIPLALRQMFADNKRELAATSVVKVLTASKEWLLLDPPKNRRYYIVKDYAIRFQPRLKVYTPARTLAWHHLPQALWRSDCDFITTMDNNWDVILDGQKIKWKDFPGIFCQQVPLATTQPSFYRQYGDVFGWLLGTISLALAAGGLISVSEWYRSHRPVRIKPQLGIGE